MDSLFSYTDDDGDKLQVRESVTRDSLLFDVVRDPARLERDKVLELHAALGEWLYPVHTPEWANKSLIEQMIERAVKDQVAAVLPLHLKPGDRFLMADADGRVWADPEPHDVGHAEEPEGVHRPQDCPGQPECAEGESKPDHGRLMSELPRRTRPRPICVSCGHGWGEHTAGICWGRNGSEDEGDHCACTRERPGTAPAPCTCPVGPRIRSYPHSHIVGCPRSSSGTS